MLTGEIRQTKNTIAELKEKVSKYCGKHISSKEKITCISSELKKEVNIERINQGLKEFVEGNDEIPETLLKSVSLKLIGQDSVIENNNFEDQIISPDISGKIRKLRQGCNSFWIHYEHEVKSCTIATDDLIAN